MAMSDYGEVLRDAQPFTQTVVEDIVREYGHRPPAAVLYEAAVRAMARVAVPARETPLAVAAKIKKMGAFLDTPPVAGKAQMPILYSREAIERVNAAIDAELAKLEMPSFDDLEKAMRDRFEDLTCEVVRSQTGLVCIRVSGRLDGKIYDWAERLDG